MCEHVHLEVTSFFCRRSYIVCKCKAFLPNGLACVSWGCQLLYSGNHIVCKETASLLSVLAFGAWGDQFVYRRSCTVYKQTASLPSVLVCAFLGYHLVWRSSCTVCNKRLFSWVFQHVPLEAASCCAGIAALCANKRLSSTVNQHVPFQLRSTGTTRKILHWPPWPTPCWPTLPP